MLADEDIIFFLLEPVGLICVIVVGALSLAILAFEQAALMGVLQANDQGVQINYVDALQFALRKASVILRLMARIMVVLLLFIAPFLLALGIVYFTLLTQYDINYYLSQRPTEFFIALAWAGFICSGLIILILYMTSFWLFSLPLVLFENIKPSAALSLSRKRSQGYRLKLIKWIFSWALIMLLLSTVLYFLVIGLGHLLIPEASESLPLLSIMIGITLVVWLLTNLLVNLLGATSFSVILFDLYNQYGSHGKQDITQLVEQRAQEHSTFRLTKKSLLIAAMLGIALSTVIGYGAIYSVQFEDRTEIIAHRGASASAPENTLAAVRQAIIDQADWVEIDVQETADGEVVVFHDSDFMKLANIDLKIWDANMEDLADIDIGSHYHTRFSAERVPTLRQMLAASKGKIRVIIELKYYGYDQHLEQRVAEIVEAEQMQASIVLMSLKSDKVKKMKALRPEWQVGLLSAAAIGDLSNAQADFLAVNSDLAQRSFVRSVHNNGKQVFVWTVNDASTMSAMIGRGVDGLITDKPALARMVLQRRASMPPLGLVLMDLADILGLSPEFNSDLRSAHGIS